MVPSLLLTMYLWPGTSLVVVYFFIRLTLSAFVFYCVTRILTNATSVESCLTTLSFGALVTSIWAVFQAVPFLAPSGEAFTARAAELFRYGYTLSPHDGVNRAAASFTDPNALGGVLAVLFPMIIGTLVFRGRDARFIAFHGTCAVVVLAALILTYSRGAWLAAVTGLLVLLTLGLVTRQLRVNRVVVVAAAVCVVFLFLSTSIEIRNLFWGRLGQLARPLDFANVQSRLQGHPRFIEAIKTDPGVLIWGNSLRQIDLGERGIIPASGIPGFVSNSWLLLILDMGLVATLFFVAVYFGAVRAIIRSLGRARDDPERLLLAGMLAGLASMAVAFAVDNYFAVQIFMRGFAFALLGLAFAVVNCVNRASSRSFPE